LKGGKLRVLTGQREKKKRRRASEESNRIMEKEHAHEK